MKKRPTLLLSGLRPALLVLLLALAVTSLVSTDASAAPIQPGAAVRSDIARKTVPRILWGAWIGNAMGTAAAPWDMRLLSSFSSTVKKAPSIVHFYQDFENCGATCSLTSFPNRYLTAIRAAGAVPMLSWASMASQEDDDLSRLSLRSIASGKLDGYLRRFALGAKAWGHPFFLRFDWEMNVRTGAFPWSVYQRGNSAALYVAAWRHVHDIFTAAGANNVTWVWCPNTSFTRSQADEYPGNAYVNWTCLDGYNWGTSPGVPAEWGGWQSFAKIYASSYAELRKIALTKPIMVGEFASTEIGGSKASWIKTALATIPSRFPAIRAIVYFNSFATGVNWTVNTSAASQRAFAQGIASPEYATSQFAHLGAGPIYPLTLR